jgi:hypothetical protein
MLWWVGTNGTIGFMEADLVLEEDGDMLVWVLRGRFMESGDECREIRWGKDLWLWRRRMHATC